VARNRPKAREPGSIADVVARLVLWASRPARGFARVEFHSEYARAEADRRLGETLQREDVPYHRIELPVNGAPSGVVRTLLQRLQDLEPAAVSITGFATAVPDGSRREFLGLLTWNRENFAACNHRQVWWMSPDFVDAFIHTVPDLDSWFLVRLSLMEEVPAPPKGLRRFNGRESEKTSYKLDEALRRATSLVTRFLRAKEMGAEPSELIQLAGWAAEAIVEVEAPNLTKDLADQLFSEAMGLCETPGADPLSTVRCFAGLGRVLRARGGLREAESLFRRALAVAEAKLGPEHPDTARDLQDLGGLSQALGRPTEAELLLRRALAIAERNSGSDHPDVARILNDLAELFLATNRLDEAEALLRRALAIWERCLGPDHPDVALALNNLSWLLQAANRRDEAEALLRRALAIDERTFGPDHPNVARDLNKLAVTLQDTDREDEAEPLLRRALEIEERRYGPDHPKVANKLNNLAALLREMGRLDQAEPLFRRALAIEERSYGPNHPQVALVLNNLALLLADLGRMAEAEPLMRRALEIFVEFSQSTGHEHPHLRAAIENYEGILEALGQSPEQIRARLDETGRPFGMSLSKFIGRHPG
jgi:tetratricopeptide (TPR) repeat protein